MSDLEDKRSQMRAMLVGVLRSRLVQWLAGKLAAVLGFSITGLQGWLVKLVAEKFFKELFLPLIHYAIDQGYLYADRKRGQIVVKRLRESGTVDEYRRNLDDLG